MEPERRGAKRSGIQTEDAAGPQWRSTGEPNEKAGCGVPGGRYAMGGKIRRGKVSAMRAKAPSARGAGGTRSLRQYVTLGSAPNKAEGSGGRSESNTERATGGAR